MIKLLRNHYFDQGCILKSGYNFTKNIMESILKLEEKELKLCHKLTNYHLSVKGAERQNVRKAVQIFSSSVATFIAQFLPQEGEASNFIYLINNLFDLFNSRKEFEKFTISRVVLMGHKVTC